MQLKNGGGPLRPAKPNGAPLSSKKILNNLGLNTTLHYPAVQAADLFGYVGKCRNFLSMHWKGQLTIGQLDPHENSPFPHVNSQLFKKISAELQHNSSPNLNHHLPLLNIHNILLSENAKYIRDERNFKEGAGQLYLNGKRIFR